METYIPVVCIHITDLYAEQSVFKFPRRHFTREKLVVDGGRSTDNTQCLICKWVFLLDVLEQKKPWEEENLVLAHLPRDITGPSHDRSLFRNALYQVHHGSRLCLVQRRSHRVVRYLNKTRFWVFSRQSAYISNVEVELVRGFHVLEGYR